MPITRQRSDFPDTLLDEIAAIMHADSFEDDTFLDLVELVLHTVPDLDEDEDESDDDAPEPDPSDWQAQARALARVIAADTTGRYVQLPQGSPAPGRLSAFLAWLPDPALAEQVERAAKGGRGAYRRVKDMLHRRGQLDLWYEFNNARDRTDVLEWLQDEGVLPEDPSD